MSSYLWPDEFQPQQWKLWVEPNERFFQGFYSGQGQAIDLLGEYWRCTFALPPSRDVAKGGRLEAFFDRLRGRTNLIQLWNCRRPQPRGTMRGAPTLYSAAAQLASQIVIQSVSGATLEAGDTIGLGGQVSRVLYDAAADGAGRITVDVVPRLRTALSSGVAITWNRPLISFRQANAGGLPLQWIPRSFEGPTLDLAEA